jgi:hypothetical protein
MTEINSLSIVDKCFAYGYHHKRGETMVGVLGGISHRSFLVLARHRDVFFKMWKTSLIPPFLDPLFYLLGMGYG